MNPGRHSITVKSSEIRNRLVSRCWNYESWTPDQKTPHPPRRQYDALWDTGATQCLVTKRVVDDLGLQAEGFTKVLHVGGMSINVPRYFINLVVLTGLHFPKLQAVQGNFLGTDVIIGMDIINRGDFAVSNRNGATSFSFRIPSVEDFDFAAADNVSGPSAAGNGDKEPH